MKILNKKNTAIILVLFSLLFVFFVFKAHTANACTTGTTGCYQMLSSLPGLGEGDGTVDVSASTTSPTGGFGNYLKSIIKLFFGVVGFLAVVMVVLGGIEYMTSGGAEEKSEGKGRIMNALFGLTLALSAWLILNTINPDLVNLGVTIPHVDYTDLSGDDEGPIDYGDNLPPAPSSQATSPAATNCSSVQACSAIILGYNSAGKITLLTTSDGNKYETDHKVDPYTEMTDVYTTGSMWTSPGGDKKFIPPKAQSSIDIRILKALIIIADNVGPITVTAFGGGVHSNPGDSHYSGRAVDIGATPSNMNRVRFIEKICHGVDVNKGFELGPCDTTTYKNTPKGSSKSTFLCHPEDSSITSYTNNGHQTHVHCQYNL